MKCIIGTCRRPGEGVAFGQLRCREHLAAVAAALAPVQAATQAAAPPVRRNLFGKLKGKGNRRYLMERTGKEPLLVRFLRPTSLGTTRDGEVIDVAPGDEIDLVEVFDKGAVKGSDNVSAERFAQNLIGAQQAVLVNASDRERLMPAWARQ
jgi:hypothetical protein